MAEITLEHLWSAPVDDLSDTLALAVTAEGEVRDDGADVRRGANGRDRVVRTPGETVEISFEAVHVARADYATIVARLGVLQLFRDARGRAFSGVIISVQGDEWPADQLLERVSFSVRSATWSEIV